MKRWLPLILVAACVAGLLAFSRRDEASFTDAEKKAIASLALTALPRVPPDPSNRYADDPAAAALGATLFFDIRMSGKGNVSCSTCHQLERQFQDDLPRGHGISDSNRRTMPLSGVAYNTWFFWDGHRDSLWSQAITPMEDAREHGGDRAFYAHFTKREFGERYERIFGPLPDLSGVPEHAGPLGTPAERAAWKALTPAEQDGVNRVFANIGKAIEAFERSFMPTETRFDRFAAALAADKAPAKDEAFSELEIEGLKLFIGSANCSTCHNGPRFTDGQFHNTGIPPVASLPPDNGRADGVKLVGADPFNCLGRYSDAKPEECGELRFMVKSGRGLERAFKTPSLRGVAGRPPYMHAGQIATLEDAVAHYADAPAEPKDGSELHTIRLTDRGRLALVAFLKTLGD
ncbi:MAG: cytochrome-c peroxidase [Rhizobiaceae bacterium]